MRIIVHGRPKVFYVDPDAECLQAAAYGLMDDAGVTTFQNFSVALDAIQKVVSPEIVISDLSNKNGLNFLRQAAEINPDVVGIAVTDLSSDHDLVLRAQQNSPFCWGVYQKDAFFKGPAMVLIVCQASEEYGRRYVSRLRGKYQPTIVERLVEHGMNREDAERHTAATLTPLVRLCTHLLTYLDMPSADKQLLLLAANWCDLGMRIAENSIDRSDERAALTALFADRVGLEKVYEAIRDRWEWYDGKGSQGMSGKRIPLLARILAVVAFVDETIKQCIREETLAIDELCRSVENQKGTRFDPEVGQVFLQMIRDQYEQIAALYQKR